MQDRTIMDIHDRTNTCTQLYKTLKLPQAYDTLSQNF